MINKWLVLISIFILSACGGGSEDSSVDPIPEPKPNAVSIYAENTADYISAGVSAVIDLSPHVKTSDGSAVYIKNVKSLNNANECGDVKINALNFEVKVNDITACNYEYTVSDNTNTVSETRVSRVAVQGARGGAGSELPIITREVSANSTTTINLATELGSGLPAGMTLDESSVIVLGNGTVIADETNNTIEFQSTISGYANVLYSVISQNREVTKLGSIIISISTDTLNHAPTALNFEAEGGEDIAVDQEIIINVKDNITDDDDDELQLIQVIATGATITFPGSAGFTNTSFTFSTKNVGASYITYIVSDHNGGYAAGQIKVNVAFPEEPILAQGWNDITTENTLLPLNRLTTFTAPLSQKFADYYSIPYTETSTNTDQHHTNYGPDEPIIMMTAQQAANYCKTRHGRLPTIGELEVLSDLGNLAAYAGWPVKEIYWSANAVSNTEAEVKLMRYATDAMTTLPKEGTAYVTCVLLKEGIPDFTLSGLKRLGESGITTIYTAKLLDPYGNGAAFQPITLSTENQFGLFPNNGDIDDLRETIVYFTNNDGDVAFSYFDSALHDEIIKADFISNTDKIIYNTKTFSLIDINVTNSSNWSRCDLNQLGVLSGIDEKGLPIFHNTSRTHVANVYSKKTYTGDNFLAFWVNKQLSPAPYGRYSFSIQQVSSSACSPDFNTWNDTTGNNPGVPQSKKQVSFVIDLEKNNARVYFGTNGVIVTPAVPVEEVPKLNAPELYNWLHKRGNKVFWYVSETPKRPDNPTYIIPFTWGAENSIKPAENYWIGFGSYLNNSTNTAHIESAGFTAY